MKITYFLTKKAEPVLKTARFRFFVILFYFYLHFHIFDDLFIISLLH